MTPPSNHNNEANHHHESHHHHKSHHHKSHHKSHHHTSHHHKSHHHKSRHHESGHRSPSGKRLTSPSRHASRSSEHNSRHSRRHHHNVTGPSDVESGRRSFAPDSPRGMGAILTVILIILGISAIALFSVGIWLLATRTGWPSGLINTGSLISTRLISYASACILVAILFVLLIILAAWATIAKYGSLATPLGLIAIFLASLSAFILLLMTITAILFAASPSFICDINENAWINSVLYWNSIPVGSSVRVTCNIQDYYNCQGWNDNSCVNCKPTVDGQYNTDDGRCTPLQQEVCPKCPVVSGRASTAFLPRTSTIQTRRYFSGKHLGISAFNPSNVTVKERMVVHENPLIDKNHSTSRQQVLYGCRRYIEQRDREFFIPMAIYTGLLILVLIIFSWRICIDTRR